MKLYITALLSAALLASASGAVQAQTLLGVIGGKDDNALVTIGSGDAGTTGLVNVGAGGQQVLDVNIGNGNLGTATVDAGGDAGLVDADVRLLNNNARINARIGGDDLVNVNVGVGGGNGNGNGANPNPNPGGNGPGGVVPGGNTASRTGGDPACLGISETELEKLIRSTRLDGSWNRASNVAIQPVNVCPAQRSWLAAALTSSGLGIGLRSAIAADPLLAASLSRTSYNAERVFAVRQDGNQLTVFVY